MPKLNVSIACTPQRASRGETAHHVTVRNNNDHPVKMEVLLKETLQSSAVSAGKRDVPARQQRGLDPFLSTGYRWYAVKIDGTMTDQGYRPLP